MVGALLVLPECPGQGEENRHWAAELTEAGAAGAS